jgi:K+:H+ antiporter
MLGMSHEIAFVINLTICLVAALVLGLITERLKLSPIVGYLLAGVFLAPRTPGLVGDPHMAAEFAEIGVVLLMFGVGIHFNLKDLWQVRKIAIPGAIGQIAVATLLGTLASWSLGLSLTQGLIMGMAISVASTVVLIRMLADNDELQTNQGRIAVGWLIVEDIFTVLALVALPPLANIVAQNGEGGQSLPVALGLALLRIAVLTLIVLGGGSRLVPWLLTQVARTRSRELFTLAVLAIALSIAAGSSYFFGVSMALGAFLAGVVVGQSELSHQAAADALPMRDAFAVLFFVSVGMLFDPNAVTEKPLLLALLLVIALVAKPFAAFAIVWLFGYSVRSALTIAIALAQVGEFSFLLAGEAVRHELLPTIGQSLLVATAIVSITLNPLMFRAMKPFERWLRTRPKLWQALTSRSEAGAAELNKRIEEPLAAKTDADAPPVARAVVVGYGPVGQTATRLLRNFGIQTVVIDLNLDTVRDLAAAGELAVYGDASRREILEAAGIDEAGFLLVTAPDMEVQTLVIVTARDMNRDLQIFVRTRYLKDRTWLAELGATEICTEEAETALGFARLLFQNMEADKDRVRAEIERIHAEFGMQRLNT